MRCASPVTFWGFTTSTGSTRVQVQGLTTGAEGATCTGSQYVVLTQAEFDNATVSPFRLSLDEASGISGGILLLWAVGWGIRTVIRTLKHSDTGDAPEI